MSAFPFGGLLPLAVSGSPSQPTPLGLKSSDLKNHDSGLKSPQKVPSFLSRKALPSPDRASNLLRILVTLPHPAWSLFPKMEPPASPIASLPCRLPSSVRSLSPFSRKSFHQSNLSALPLPATLSVTEAMATGGGGQGDRVA